MTAERVEIGLLVRPEEDALGRDLHAVFVASSGVLEVTPLTTAQLWEGVVPRMKTVWRKTAVEFVRQQAEKRPS